MSNTMLTGIVAAVCNQGGGDIDDITLSKSSARRHRAASRKELAGSIKQNFTCSVGQINFDGKLMKNLGGYGKTNRLAVVLVTEAETKLLCVAKLESSTGKVEAETVKEVLVDWGISEQIIACGFDTTSFNTGIHKGSVVMLQKLLAKLLLSLACRHHIHELVLAAAFTELFGVTTGPEVVLFKVLKESWDSLNLDDLQLPTIPSFYRSETEELLSFISDKLEDSQNLPRCDYKEFL